MPAPASVTVKVVPVAGVNVAIPAQSVDDDVNSVYEYLIGTEEATR